MNEHFELSAVIATKIRRVSCRHRHHHRRLINWRRLTQVCGRFNPALQGEHAVLLFGLQRTSESLYGGDKGNVLDVM